jgi:hypothetical protein
LTETNRTMEAKEWSKKLMGVGYKKRKKETNKDMK